MYEVDEEKEKKYKEELEELRFKASNGDPWAQLKLSFYMQAGIGCKIAMREAKKWCILSAKQGNLLAESRCLLFGWERTKDEQKSADIALQIVNNPNSSKLEMMLALNMCGRNYQEGC